MTERAAGPSGILVVDKPEGPTSHDVVGWARRALGTKTIGHAGTLDPFASGVLVVLVGEATKLAAYATAEDKTYLTEIALGEETDTLDREGVPIAGATVPPLSRAEVEEAIARIAGRLMQVPPRVSAIKKDGVRHYERARMGETVEPEPRPATLYEARLEALAERSLTVHLRTGKGYYVRSFGRDLALLLGTRGHLASLRRLRSGRYAIDDALPGRTLERAGRGDVAAQAEVRGKLVPLTRATVPLPCLDVDEALAADLRCGKKKDATVLPALGDGAHLCFLGETPIAIVERRDGVIRVLRGIVL